MRAAILALALSSCCAPAAAPAPCPLRLAPPPMVVIPEGYTTPFQLDPPTVLVVEMDLDLAGDWIQRCLDMGGEPISVRWTPAFVVTSAECDDVDY